MAKKTKTPLSQFYRLISTNYRYASLTSINAGTGWVSFNSCHKHILDEIQKFATVAGLQVVRGKNEMLTVKEVR